MTSEEYANFTPKDDQPGNSRDPNPPVTIWIIVDETTYKDPATFHLRNCKFRHAMGTRTFYTSPLRKCQKS